MRYASRMMRSCVLLAPALALALAAAGCSSDRDPGDPNKNKAAIMKVKIEAARQALAEIQRRKDKGKAIYADCKTAKMLFLADLKQHESPQVRQLATDLLTACQKASASELVEGSP